MEDTTELKNILKDLLLYFELHEDSDLDEWPMVSIYSGGRYQRGVIEDELYDILIQLRDVYTEIE